MLDMIFQYDREPILIQRIIIGFKDMKIKLYLVFNFTSFPSAKGL